MAKVIPQFSGTAVPNFGQAGGGVEAYFNTDATNDFGSAHKIPDY
ncbi:MAG: hypothetical protein AAGA02_12735 [Bacteroidota bacterium]